MSLLTMLIYQLHKTYPYTPAQLSRFAEEIRLAGGFKNLMLKKEALQKRNALQYSLCYHNPYAYEDKYLVDVYKPLRHLFKTETPYTFWNEMYQKLKSVETGGIQ